MMKKIPVVRLLIAAVIYTVLFVLGSCCGLIHPACYAYVGTFLPILFSFVYLYTAANLRTFGAAAILNGIGLVIGLIAGEGNLALIIGMIILALLAELIRRINGYETLKGVQRSFIPLAFSFYAYAAHWWTNTEESLAEAVEEMPVGYIRAIIRGIATGISITGICPCIATILHILLAGLSSNIYTQTRHRI